MLVALQPGHIGARELSGGPVVLARTRAPRRRVLRSLLLTMLQAALLAGAACGGYAFAGGWPLLQAGPAAAAAASAPKAEPWRAEL